MNRPRKRPVARAPGRPRSTASRNAILKAAYQILRERGFAGFTVEGVAARAGAGKATIYRWWQTKGTLAIEAFLVAIAPRMDSVPHTDSAIADLRRQVHVAAMLYRGRVGQLLRELIALGQEDSETSRALRSDFVEPRRQAALAALRRAQATGEIGANHDIDVLADALWGPIFHRLLVSRMPLDRGFIDKLLDLVLGGARARPAPAATTNRTQGAA
ncbi:MAG TPA: TetR/AcrR family transcriptional regulator [Steroidobacteraceae bacterium]|nr:TetR/AcrR family transcriptional regulator [Steroidobacteraceae bacterium]